MNIKCKKIDYIYAIVSTFIGFIFIVNYIFKSSMSIPAGDYIRIINNYLDNVFDINKFLVPDLIARVPITYLFRIINVSFFKYSMHFDRIVGAIFLAIFNYIIVINIRKKLNNVVLKNVVSVCLSIIIFSLISWEMILNGTGYPIFIFFTLVLLIYDIYEKNIKCVDCITCDNKKNTCKIKIVLYLLLIIATCILTGSDYQVALLFTIIFFSFIYFVTFLYQDNKNKQKSKTKPNRILYLIHNRYLIYILVCVFVFMIYWIGNHVGYAGDYTYVGMSDRSFIDILLNDFPYVFSFVIKSMASIIIGVETFEYAVTLNTISEGFILFIGIIFVLIVLLTIILIFVYKLYKKDIFSVMIFFHGLLSVLLVFVARSPFLNDHYGMSSRYSIQFMLVPVGCIMILSNLLDDVLAGKIKLLNKINTVKKNKVYKYVTITVFSLILFFVTYGRTLTSLDEMNKVRARYFCYESAYNLAHNLDDYPPSDENDKFLMEIFGYNRSAALIRSAFQILKNNKLNIYSNEN